jgi:hypothetical protein
MTSPLNVQMGARASLHLMYGLPQRRYSKEVNEMCSVLVLSFYWLHVYFLSRGTQKYSCHEKRKIIKDLQKLTLDTLYLLRGSRVCPSLKQLENVAHS